MNDLTKAYRHFKTVMKHKAIVFNECRACGLFWQGLIHDLSKFSPVEFLPSAKYFQGDKSPITAQKIAEGYSIAWLHHKGRNRHHWEYWTDFGRGGRVKSAEIPVRYVVEMVCDWIAAGKVYGKEKWTQSEPLDYYYRHREARYFHSETEKLVMKLLRCIKDNGLEEFHKMARNELKEGRRRNYEN